MHSSIYSMGREVGRKEGKLEGREEAKRETLRRAVEAMCDVLDVKLTARRRAQIEGLDAAGLEALFGVLRDERTWPARRPAASSTRASK